MKIIDSQQQDIDAELKRIINRGETATDEVAVVVKEVVERVRKEGDPAVLEYTEKFDRVTLTLKDLKVTPAGDQGTPIPGSSTKKVDALKLAAQNIRAFHEKQKISSWVSQEADGVILGQLARPIRSAGVYVPGGKACYPSSVLMNVIPAKVAGVEQLVMCSPVPGGTTEPVHPCCRRHRGGHRDLQDRRRAGDRGHGIRHRDDPEGRQDRGTGQYLRGHGQTVRFRPGGHRHDRGAERDTGHCRRLGEPGLCGLGSAFAGGTR